LLPRCGWTWNCSRSNKVQRIHWILALPHSQQAWYNLCCIHVCKVPGQSKEIHFSVAKRILKYLKGTINVGLWYPNKATLNLNGYSNSYFAGCKLDRKSTSGTCHLLGASLISWNSKKQACIALSTAEAEYITVGSCYAQICWLKQQLSDYCLTTRKRLFRDQFLATKWNGY